ncbi:MAG: T9SS type A sorting domain-containing protein, partial [Bacteroidota bacterium]
MIRSLLVIILFLFGLQSYAQHSQNWYFPESVGIRFSAGEVNSLSGGKISTSVPANVQIRPTEGGACISDSKGNLLFYTDGLTIWNRNHTPMKGGQNLKGGPSATQPASIVPDPGNPSRFYIFTVDDFQHILKNGLCYSVVDMCLDNGLGDVTDKKNVPLLDIAGEKQAITKHKNDTDYWLVVHKHYTQSFYAYKISTAGISKPVISSIGSYHGGGLFDGAATAIGQIKIAPDGKRIGLVNSNMDVGNDKALLEVFNFDNETGVISNYVNLTSMIYPIFFGFYGGYGFTFSPNSQNIYVSTRVGILQFHLYGETWSYVNKINPMELNPTGGMQLAPNGKIYIAKGEAFLASISNPNDLLPNIGFKLNDVFLDDGIATWSLPGFYDGFRYTQEDPLCAPDNTVPRESDDCGFMLYPNPSNGNLTLKLNNSLYKNIRFYNAIGQIVLEYSSPGRSVISLDIKDLSEA